MTTVLVVDDNRAFLESLVSNLSRYAAEFTVFAAENGEEGARIVTSRPVDVLVTDLDMPVMDGFELVALMVQNHPSVEIVLMGDVDSGRVGRALSAGGTFYYLQKPVAARAVAALVRAISARSARGRLMGLSVAGFLQLLHSERKTCSLVVSSAGKVARLTLLEGEIVTAVTGSIESEEAVYETLSWPHPEIEIDESIGTAQKVIKTPLSKILMDAAVQRDHSQTAREAEAESARRDAATALPQVVEGVSAGGPEARGASLSEDEMGVVRLGLEMLLSIEGAICAALVDLDTCSCVASASKDQEVDLVAVALRTCQIAKAPLRETATEALADRVKQITIALPDQFALIRPLHSNSDLVFYFSCDVERTDPAEATDKLAEIEELIAADTPPPPAPTKKEA